LIPSHRKQLVDLVSRYYTAEARTYEEFAAPTFSLTATRLVNLAGVRERQSVLDVGTGTGIAALMAATRVGRLGSVLGIDLAPGMLTIARQKASAANLRNVRFRRMDAAHLPLPDDSFDSALSNFGTPMDSFPEVASGVFRVLRKGGVFCVAEATDHSISHHVVSRVFRKYRTPSPDRGLKRIRQLWAELAELAARYPLQELDLLMEKAGFKEVRVLSEDFTVPLQDAATSLSYWIEGERAEYAAISSEARREFRREALQELETISRTRGGLQTRHAKFWVGTKTRLSPSAQSNLARN
jgi:ubiquinone/menaquinone biosynthesis C-methylase UbiE